MIVMIVKNNWSMLGSEWTARNPTLIFVKGMIVNREAKNAKNCKV